MLLMAIDNFLGAYRSDLSPATRAVPVTPSDTVLLDPVPRSLYVGGAGSLVVDTIGGDTSVTFLAVTSGTLLPLRVTRVYAATSATDIVALS
jgi:hypothetical protein